MCQFNGTTSTCGHTFVTSHQTICESFNSPLHIHVSDYEMYNIMHLETQTSLARGIPQTYGSSTFEYNNKFLASKISKGFLMKFFQPHRDISSCSHVHWCLSSIYKKISQINSDQCLLMSGNNYVHF